MAVDPRVDRIPLPERIDRRMRFGPFPSVRDALRFVAYSAAGALVIPWVGAWAWLPLVGAAFLLTVWHPDGSALDERIATYLRWASRAHREEGAMSDAPSVDRRGDTVRLASGVRVAIVRCGGSPAAFLPAEELVRRFHAYRDLLRAAGGGIALASTGTPIDARPWIPAAVGAGRGDRAARDAYAQMVELLCSRRHRRRVYALLWQMGSDPATPARLDERANALHQRLEALGAAPERLRDRSLREAVRHFGWTGRRGP